MKNQKVGDVVNDNQGLEKRVLAVTGELVALGFKSGTFSWYRLVDLTDYTLVEPEEQWSCGKCDREAKGINDSEIPNHFRTCPKASVKPEKTLEEKFISAGVNINTPFAKYMRHLAQIAAEHYKNKQN